MSTDDRFTEIVERHEAATKGPYEWIEAAVMADGYTYVNDLDSPHAGDDPVASGRVAGEGADLEALAHSWADRAWLIAEVRRLRGALKRYAEQSVSDEREALIPTLTTQPRRR